MKLTVRNANAWHVLPVVAVAALGAGALIANFASAIPDNYVYESEVHLFVAAHPTGAALYVGRVTGGGEECEGNREVTIRNHTRHRPIATTTTRHDGVYYVLAGRQAGGDLIDANVEAKFIRDRGVTGLCKAGSHQDVAFPTFRED